MRSTRAFLSKALVGGVVALTTLFVAQAATAMGVSDVTIGTKTIKFNQEVSRLQLRPIEVHGVECVEDKRIYPYRYWVTGYVRYVDAQGGVVNGANVVVQNLDIVPMGERTGRTDNRGYFGIQIPASWIAAQPTPWLRIHASAPGGGTDVRNFRCGLEVPLRNCRSGLSVAGVKEGDTCPVDGVGGILELPEIAANSEALSTPVPNNEQTETSGKAGFRWLISVLAAAGLAGIIGFAALQLRARKS